MDYTKRKLRGSLAHKAQEGNILLIKRHKKTQDTGPVVFA